MMICRNPHRRSISGRVILTGVVLLALGCDRDRTEGSREGAAPLAREGTVAAGAAVDPCALVTREEAGVVLDAPVDRTERPPSANHPPRMVACNHIAPRGQAVAVLTVVLYSGADADGVRQGFEDMQQGFSDVQAVPGLGDRAVWFAEQLHVLDGTHHLIIGGLTLERAKAIAAKALARLPS